jgi:Na+/H+-dicarboxylate symporter
MILAVQNLKEMSKGGAKLARWTLLYYVLTTIFSVIHSQILVDVAWRKLMVPVGNDALQVSSDDQETIDENSSNAAHDIVVQVAESFIPNNVVAALAEDSLLAVLVTAVVVGCLIRGPAENSPLLRAVKEIDRIVAKIITFLIALAPIGVFFLILANLMTLNMEDIGQNLGVLIGASIGSMFIQLFIVFPLLFFAFVRQNPYSFWLKNSPAWITAWGSASSVATLPVTLRCLNARGVPTTVSKFTAPLGALINMVSIMLS